jgi:type V secretory pathway adhesin AidA
MALPTITTLSPKPDFTEVVQKLNKLIQDYNNTLLNLDSLNVVSLTASNIDTGILNAGIVTIRSDLTAGAYIQIDGNGMVVNNGTFDTFTVDINGAVTMTSATIQSASGYPKVVIDPNNDLFGAFNTANDYIAVEADYGGAPSLNFFAGGTLQARMDMLLGFEIFNNSSTNPMVIDGGTMGTRMGNIFTFDDWSSIINFDSTTTLQMELDAKAASGDSTSLSGGHNHGIPDVTVLMVDGGGTVTFVAVGNHSHTQI